MITEIVCVGFGLFSGCSVGVLCVCGFWCFVVADMLVVFVLGCRCFGGVVC